MHIDREEFVNEIKLREQIRRAIKIYQHRESEELKLRNIVRSIILEQKGKLRKLRSSTGISELEILLKKIIPQLEDDYKILTTDPEQRTSFRAHIIHYVQNTLSTALPDGTPSSEPTPAMTEDINVSVSDDEAFIPVRDQDEEPQELEEPEDPASPVVLQGHDETGARVAQRSYKKIETAIEDSYSMLKGTPSDQEIFYDYLLTNLKLYFDKFDDEMASELPEPTTPEYEDEVRDREALPSKESDI